MRKQLGQQLRLGQRYKGLDSWGYNAEVFLFGVKAEGVGQLSRPQESVKGCPRAVRAGRLDKAIGFAFPAIATHHMDVGSSVHKEPGFVANRVAGFRLNPVFNGGDAEVNNRAFGSLDRDAGLFGGDRVRQAVCRIAPAETKVAVGGVIPSQLGSDGIGVVWRCRDYQRRL